MKKIFTIFLLLGMCFCYSGGFSQTQSNTPTEQPREILSYQNVCVIMDEVQPIFWQDLRMTTTQLVTEYYRGSGIIEKVGTGLYYVEVGGCSTTILVTDLD